MMMLQLMNILARLRPLSPNSSPARGEGSRAGFLSLRAACFSPFALFAVLLVLLPLTAQADRAQARRLYLNTNGDLALIGNMLFHCTGNGTACNNARSLTTPANVRNNDSGITMGPVDVDGDGSTTSSSSANLNMPAGSTVEWAGLYWGGTYTNGAALPANANQLKFRTPLTGYQTLTASTIDTNLTSTTNDAYQAFVDVTAQVRAAGNGTYWGADLVSRSAGSSWGGWALVVAYSNPALPFRNFAVYDGFGYISNQTVTMTPTGFLTPLNGPVVSRLGVLLWDGDRQAANTDERLLLNGVSIYNAENREGDVWNSTVTDMGAHVTSRNPSYLNTLGVDIDRFNVPVGVIPNGATSATIGIRSPGTDEVFWFGVGTFVTDIYVPVVIPNVVKTAEDMSPSTPLLRGDTLRWHVVMSNTGWDSATNLTATDIIPPWLTYVPNSLRIVSGANAGTKSDNTDTDQAEYLTTGGPNRVVFRLGTGANGTQGGVLAKDESTSFYFDTTVDNDTPAGALLSNEVQIQYNSQTIPATTFAASSAAATASVTGPPTIAKSFSPSVIDMGQNSVLTITLRNPAGNPETLTNVTFSDTYPAGLVNTVSPNPQVSCTSGSTVGTITGGTANGNTIGLNPGATIAPNGVCLVSVNVTSNTLGNYTNTTGNVVSSNGGPGGTATAMLSVGKPRITKAFSPASILSGGTSTITFTLQNLGATPLTGMAFGDTLANMQVANPASVANTCGGTVTAVPANNSIALAGGTLAATGSCSITVNVTSSTMGIHPNTTTGVSSNESGAAGNPSNTAELTVVAPPVLAKSFALASVRTNTPVQMTLTLTNPNTTTTITGAAFSDGAGLVPSGPAYPSGMTNSTPANAQLSCTSGSTATLAGGVNGGSNVGLTGGTLLPGGSCTITLYVQSSSTGTKDNTTSTVTTANAGTGMAVMASIIVSNSLSATKSFNATAVAYNNPPSASTYSTMTIALSESGSGNANNVNFVDDFPSGLYVQSLTGLNNGCSGTLQGRTGNGAWGTVAVGNTSLRLVGGTVNANCSITVRVTSDETGLYTNVIGSITSDNKGDFGPISANLNVLGPPQVTKSFSPDSISTGGTSTLTITVSNPTTATAALTNVTVNDFFPTNMLTASSSSSRACTNPTSTPANARFVARNSGNNGWDTGMANNRAGVQVNGLTLEPNQTCTFSISVDASTAGTYPNTTSAITSDDGGTGNTASATLTVGQIDVTKTLCTTSVLNAIKANDNCAMTLALTNQTGSVQAITLIDHFPGQTPGGGAFVLNNTTLGGSCSATGRTLDGYTGSSSAGIWSAAAAGNTGIRLGVNVPTGGCTVTLNVRSTETLTNTIAAGGMTAGIYSNGAPTSATLYIAEPLQVQKSFDVGSVPVNGTANMTISLTNLNAVTAGSIELTDVFPAGLQLAGAVSANTCGTLGTVVQGRISGGWGTPAAGHTQLRITGGSLAGGNICSLTAPVTSATAGVYVNSTGTVTSSVGDTPASQATLTVMGAPSPVVKAFTPDVIQVGEVSLLTIMLTNPNASAAIMGVAFTDTYPAGMVNDATPDAQSSCAGGALAAAPGGNTLSLSGASIPAGSSCMVSVRVTSATSTPPGTPYTNHTGAVTTTNAGSAASVSAQLTVNPLLPILNLLKQVSVLSDPVNNTSNPKAIPGAQITYVIRITNIGPGTVDAGSIFLNDGPLPANVDLYVGTGGPATPLAGFAWQNGTPVSGLTGCTFGSKNNGSDCVDFSTNGTDWTHIPTPDADGYDPAIRHLRFRPTGPFNATGGGNPWAEFSFRVRVR